MAGKSRESEQLPTPVQPGGAEGRPARSGHMDWGHLSTVAGVFLGALGLALTGIATYYGALVSADQLEQSREEAAREEQAQARQISTWRTRQSGSEQIHVLNRSLDAIYRLHINFSVIASKPDPRGVKSSATVRTHVDLDAVPPCTELIIPRDSVKLLEPGKVGLASWNAGPVSGLGSVLDMVLMDNAGKYWLRSEHILKLAPREEFERANVELDFSKVSTKPGEYCGAGS